MPYLRAIPEEARQINQAFMFFMSQEYDMSDVDGEELSGVPGSPGTYTGPVNVIRSRFDRLTGRLDEMQRFYVGPTVGSMTAFTAVFSRLVAFLG